MASIEVRHSDASATGSFYCSVAATRGDRMTTSRARKVTGRRTAEATARTRAHADYLSAHLADDRNAAALLDVALASGDEGDIMYALRALATARGGVAGIAEAAGLSRETLYRTLSREGNPRLSTLLAIIRAAGVRLKATHM
jgi:probable addiction module antidote protein